MFIKLPVLVGVEVVLGGDVGGDVVVVVHVVVVVIESFPVVGDACAGAAVFIQAQTATAEEETWSPSTAPQA